MTNKNPKIVAYELIHRFWKPNWGNDKAAFEDAKKTAEGVVDCIMEALEEAGCLWTIYHWGEVKRQVENA